MNQKAENLQPGNPEYERLIKIRDQTLENVRQDVYEDNLIHAQQIKAEKRGEQNDKLNLEREARRQKLRKRIAEILVLFGGNTIINHDGQTALMLYAQALNLAGCQMMLRLGANPNCIDAHGRTTLHFLVVSDETSSTLAYLLDKNKGNEMNVDINAQTHGGVTPLMLACQTANAKSVVKLLQCGANPFFKDHLGQEASEHFVLLPQNCDKLQRQIPRVIEQAKQQWRLQAAEQTYLRELPSDEHFRAFNCDEPINEG